ncbi:MAG: cytochrome c-type biogenesis protein CcmH [Chloroflexi bacterium]|nr:cytochrome c-type biogenesis protein CcmH [Chloroflexota bacterium]
MRILAGLLLLGVVWSGLGMSLGASSVMADSPVVNSLAQKLVCQCGCNASLANCNHLECMVRDSMMTTIRQQVDQGKSESEIVSYFVAQYGEKVLVAPSKRGFNLTAWVTPFAAIVVGAGVLYLLLKMWVLRGRQILAPRREEPTPENEEYRQRLERELEEYARRGGGR